MFTFKAIFCAASSNSFKNLLLGLFMADRVKSEFLEVTSVVEG